MTEAERKVIKAAIAEAWFVLAGGDDPHDECEGCGLAGVGELRARLKDLEALVS